MALEVVIGLRKRKAQVHLALFGHVAELALVALHGFQVRVIRRRELLRVDQVHIGAIGVRSKLQCLVESRQRFIEATQFFQRIAHVVVGVSQCRLDGNRALIALDRLLGVGAFEPRPAQHVQRLCLVGLE